MSSDHLNFKDFFLNNRLVPNYAEAARALEELQTATGFVPRKILDFGAGCGAAFWAANEKFDSISYLILQLEQIA